MIYLSVDIFEKSTEYDRRSNASSIRLAILTEFQWVLLAEVTNWFTAYCAPRSLTNSIEWALNAVAFYHYPWPSEFGQSYSIKSLTPFFLHVCLCVIFRPTAAILWGPVCLYYFFRLRYIAHELCL